jgi:signal transduction histidine kinase
VLVLAIAGLQAYRLKIQRCILRLEKEAALAWERERIARDMHDDLGASLSKIALLSQATMKQLPPRQFPSPSSSVLGRLPVRSSIAWAT